MTDTKHALPDDDQLIAEMKALGFYIVEEVYGYSFVMEVAENPPHLTNGKSYWQLSPNQARKMLELIKSQSALLVKEAAAPKAVDTRSFRKLTDDYRPTLRHWATNLPEDEFDRVLTEYGSKVFALGFRDVNKLIEEQVEKRLSHSQEGKDKV